MTPIAAGVGVQLHYFSAGEGQPLLAIHDIGGSGELLTAELEPLAQRTRLIGYDRRGYRESEAPDPYLATTVAEQSEDAAALLLGLGASPALLVGVGFGALIALDLSLRRPELVRAALLVDPPAYSLDVESTRELADQRGAIEAALLAGSRAQAIGALLGSDADQALLANAEANSGACFADYGGLTSLPLTHREMRDCAIPIRILSTPAASAPLARIAAELDALLGKSSLLIGDELAGAAEALLD